MNRPSLAAVLALVLLASGCSLLFPVPDSSRFYVLTATASLDAGESDPGLPNVSLAIGVLNLPAYANRSEIVRRVGATEVWPSTIDRWAGPLELNFIRALSDDLARQLGTERISTYPAYDVVRADYWMQVDVVRFDLDEANRGHLIARWEVREQKPKGRSLSGLTDVSHDAPSTDTAAGVEALSLCVADLGSDLASAVRQLVRAKR